MRYLRMRLVDGSTGAELWSAITLLAMGVLWLFDPPLNGGLLYRTVRFASPEPMLALCISVASAHLFALTFPPPTLRWVWIRKICSLVESVLWSMALVGLALLHQWLSVTSLGFLLFLLFIAIGRRSYRYATP